jgi:type IV pilus assembly protein PilQ
MMFRQTSENATVQRRRIWIALGICAALTAPAIGQMTDEDPEVSVSDYGTVDLAVQDTDLAQVLQMLAIQSKKNIIASKSVSATVTANLFGVTFTEALDSILKVNGFDYVEDGNFIYVYTIEELQAIQEAQRATESRIYELQYLSAADAQEFVTPLMSDVGQSAYLGEVPIGFKPDVGDGGADTYAYTAKLIVNDYPENLNAIASLLKDLDTPPQQVLVEATILQTVLDEANAWGVDFSLIANLDFTDLAAGPLSAVGALLKGKGESGDRGVETNDAQAISSTVGNTSGPGGFKVGVITQDASVFVRVLDEVADTTVLARPKVMALNRQRAEVLVGTRIGYLSTTASETTTTQTVEFLDTGIQLIFRPFVSPNGMIRMELAPSVSEASLRAVTDANGMIVTIPDQLTNELISNVRVRDGETLVLGGLFRESTRIGRRQIPFLGDIPVLGAAFQGQDDVAERDEIIFLITPSIVQDEVLWDMGEDTLALTDALRVGARNGLLVFSTERRINNYNRDAFAAYKAGDTKMALHYANKSLGLDSSQPVIMGLRASITGQKIDGYEDSMLERIMRDSMGSLFPDAPSAVIRMSPPPDSPQRDYDAPRVSNATSEAEESDPAPQATGAADVQQDAAPTQDAASWTSEASQAAATDSSADGSTIIEAVGAPQDAGATQIAGATDGSMDSGNADVGVDIDEPSLSEVQANDAQDAPTTVWNSATVDAAYEAGQADSSTDSLNDVDSMTQQVGVANAGLEQYFKQYFQDSIFGYWLPADPGGFNNVAGVSDSNLDY